jgi:hypothetical protein
MPRSMTHAVFAAVVAAIVGAACTGPMAEPTAPDGVAAQAPIPHCEDVPELIAPAEAYRDTPIYVGNEMPVEAVRDWAIGQPGYEDIWIDREHNGWVAVAFSRDAAARQADLEREFPGVGVVAVPVDRSTVELEALQRRVMDVLPPDVAGATGVLVTKNVVMIGVGVLTPERVAQVQAAFAGQPVCIEGANPADVPAPGPQQPAGDGWRLLATEPTGIPYRTGIAWDPASLEDLWATSGVAVPIPAVDFRTEVIIWFGAVYGSSCPDLRVDDVVVDRGRRIVYAEIVLVDSSMGCTGDANPRAYLVAVHRSKLPEPTFAIQLSAEGPPGGAPEERTIVEADLRVPGSIALPEQVHADPALLQPPPQFVTSGDTIETDIPNQYLFSVHCGIEWLGTFNDVTWRTVAPAGVVDWVPPAWQQVVAMDETIIVTVVMLPGPDPSLTATANGHTVVYRPAQEPGPGCD